MRAVTGGRYQLPAMVSQAQALKQMPISPNLLAEPYKCASHADFSAHPLHDPALTLLLQSLHGQAMTGQATPS